MNGPAGCFCLANLSKSGAYYEEYRRAGSREDFGMKERKKI